MIRFQSKDILLVKKCEKINTNKTIGYESISGKNINTIRKAIKWKLL